MILEEAQYLAKILSYPRLHLCQCHDCVLALALRLTQSVPDYVFCASGNDAHGATLGVVPKECVGRRQVLRPEGRSFSEDFDENS